MDMNERASNYSTEILVAMINGGWFYTGDGISNPQSANALVNNVITVYNSLYTAVYNTLRG